MSPRLLIALAAMAIMLTGCRHYASDTMVTVVENRAGMSDIPPPSEHPAEAVPVNLAPADQPAQYANEEPSGARSHTYTLDSGDRVRVFVYGQPNLSRIYSVDGGGYISLPLIGSVNARAVSTRELETMIAARLATQYVRDPKVSVEISTYRPFFILGEVRNAGQYAYVNGMTVQTAVAIAGGYSVRANEHKVQITRDTNGLKESALVPSSHPIEPGDTIYVRERFF